MAGDLVDTIRERDEARQIVRDIHWMAKRYADGRMSYAVSQFNDAVRKGFDAGWLEWKMDDQETRYARDGMSSDEWRSIEQRLRDAQAKLASLRAALASKDAEGYRRGVEDERARITKRERRRVVAWLHARADTMNDPHARSVLNSAAFDLGLDNAAIRSLTAPDREGT